MNVYGEICMKCDNPFFDLICHFERSEKSYTHLIPADLRFLGYRLGMIM